MADCDISSVSSSDSSANRLQERERLLAIAPHLVRPMEFILPHVPELRPRWQIRLGLFFYDHIGFRRRLPASRSVSLAGTHYGQPLREHITHGFAYSDCAVDDSRLVVLNAMDAADAWRTIHTRTRFVSAERSDGSLARQLPKRVDWRAV